jgi:hypothetical protein
MRFLSLLLTILLTTNPLWAGVEFIVANSEQMSHADNTETDLNGANQQMTVMMWMKAYSACADYSNIGKYSTFNNNQQWMFYCSNQDNPRMQFLISPTGSSTGRVVANSDNDSVVVNTWVHTAGVYNDTDIRIYINGVLSGSPAALTAGISNEDAPFRIGARSSTTSLSTPQNFFDGIMDEICIYNTALTADEVLQIAKSQIREMCYQVKPDNLVFYCALDNLSDGTAISDAYTCKKGTALTPTNTPTQKAGEILSYP